MMLSGRLEMPESVAQRALEVLRVKAARGKVPAA